MVDSPRCRFGWRDNSSTPNDQSFEHQVAASIGTVSNIDFHGIQISLWYMRPDVIRNTGTRTALGADCFKPSSRSMPTPVL